MSKKDPPVITFGPNNAPTVSANTTATLVPAGTVVTASGNGSALALPDTDTLRLDLAVTAASGTTPSLTVNVQHSPDGTTWTTLASFAAKTGVSTEHKVFSGLDAYVRAQWTVSGTTPSLTFGVTGTAL